MGINSGFKGLNSEEKPCKKSGLSRRVTCFHKDKEIAVDSINCPVEKLNLVL